MKVCKECKIEKDFSLFYKNEKMKDGFLSQCKDCFYIKNKEKRKDYYLKNKAKVKLYLEKNKDKISKRSSEYHSKNSLIFNPFISQYSLTLMQFL